MVIFSRFIKNSNELIQVCAVDNDNVSSQGARGCFGAQKQSGIRRLGLCHLCGMRRDVRAGVFWRARATPPQSQLTVILFFYIAAFLFVLLYLFSRRWFVMSLCRCDVKISQNKFSPRFKTRTVVYIYASCLPIITPITDAIISPRVQPDESPRQCRPFTLVLRFSSIFILLL